MQKLQIPSEEVLFLLMMKAGFSRGNTPAFLPSFIFVMVPACGLPACGLPVKFLPVTKAGLTRPHHVCSWCQIKIKERDAGSLSAVRVRPLKCGEAGCSIRAVAVRGRGRCQSQDSGKRGGCLPAPPHPSRVLL